MLRINDDALRAPHQWFSNTELESPIPIIIKGGYTQFLIEGFPEIPLSLPLPLWVCMDW